LASGSVMRWNDHFPLSWRTGATFVHDVVAWMAFAVVTGHVVMAVTHPGAMISMLTGKVSRQWAAIHARGWLDEIDRGSQGDELGRGGCGSQGDELGAASQDVGTER